MTSRRAEVEEPVGRRAGGDGRRVACLISSNPLALGELQRLLSGAPLRIRTAQLPSGASPETLKVPRASVHVLDAFSTGAATGAVVAAIRSRHPSTRVVIITASSSDTSAFPLLQLGIKGLITHKEAPEHLARAAVLVARGGVWIPRLLLSRFLERTLGRGQEGAARASGVRRISQRERQVLNCVLKNMSNKEISAALHISESTVKFHLASLFEKFGVRRRADLILQTVQQPAALVH